MGVRLPAEYQEVEWIEGARNREFIDTGVPGDKNSLIIEAKVIPGAYAQYAPLWGNYLNENSNVTRLIAYNTSYILAHINTKAGGGTSAISAPTLFGSDKISVIRQEQKKLAIDSTVSNVRVSITESENNRTIAINASTSVNPAISNASIQRWYYVRMFDGNTKLRDFVPCYRKSDGIAGMYDLVSRAFFVNARTDKTSEFTAGPDVIDSISPLMVAWRMGLIGAKATYVEYTPINKVSVIRKFYIDTEYIPSSKSSAEMKYMGTNPQHHFLACEHFYFLSPRSISNRCGEERLSSSLVNQVATISCYRENDDIVVNGTKSGTLAAGTEEPTTSLYLLSYHGGGVNTYGFIGDFYYARIYDNDVLIRNYIPVKDSLGRVGILESISKRFWYGTDEDPAFSE